MMQFNPDGSLKLPDKIQKQKQSNEIKLTSKRCIKVKREIVSPTAPKACKLNILLSQVMNDNRFIHTIFNTHRDNSDTPLKLVKVSDKEFEVEVGTDFRRCTNCNSLINRYREFLDGNVIDIKGQCTFEGRKKSFSYEDHFD